MFQEYVRAVTDHTERLVRLEQALTDQVQTWRLAPVVDALQALRGVQFTVAVTTVAELGDLTRFDNPRQLMNYLGLTPSEYSTGSGADRAASPRRATAMPAVPWSKAPGPIATPPKSVGICNYALRRYPADLNVGRSTVNRGHEHHRSIRRCSARAGRPRRFGGAQRGRGT